MTKHPYADILQYLIDGGDISDIQLQYKDESWLPASYSPLNWGPLVKGNPDYSFRIKPKTVMFNGIELPMYEINRLNYDDKYYTPNPMLDNFANKQYWYNDEIDTIRLNRGLVFLKLEDAIAWGKAMCPRSS